MTVDVQWGIDSLRVQMIYIKTKHPLRTTRDALFIAFVLIKIRCRVCPGGVIAGEGSFENDVLF